MDLGRCLLIGALLLASGCGATFKATLTGNYAPTREETVEIYRSSAPSWPHTVIGTFEFRSQRRSLGAVFDQIREYAAASGASAVIGLEREVWLDISMRPQRDPFHAIYRGKLVRRN